MRQPDEIQREFWQYRRLWITSIVLLIAARLVFPHIPLLRGWEQKLASTSIEMGKLEIPASAIRTNDPAIVNAILKPKFEIPVGLVGITDAILVAAWPCNPMNDPGVCLRYIWKGDPLTMVVSFKPKRSNKKFGPFTRTGWGGYFFVRKDIAAAAVGPFDPSDILASWPFAEHVINHPLN